MAIVTTDNAHYRDIANAIRTKGVAGTRRPEDMAAGVLAIPAAASPEMGFVPSEWNADGYITKGRWYGTVIPAGAFAGHSATYAAYQYLTELEHVDITSIGAYAFYQCASLTTAEFLITTRIRDYAFSDCRALTTANFPLVTEIASRTFYSCHALTSAEFPLVKTIFMYAFSNCTALTSVRFPQVKTIDARVFNGCTALTNADFPLATLIGNYSFANCTALTTLILRSPTLCTLTGTNALSSTPIASGTGYVYVPAALVDAYKVATNWVTYANQIRAIEDYEEITGVSS